MVLVSKMKKIILIILIFFVFSFLYYYFSETEEVVIKTPEEVVEKSDSNNISWIWTSDIISLSDKFSSLSWVVEDKGREFEFGYNFLRKEEDFFVFELWTQEEIFTIWINKNTVKVEQNSKLLEEDKAEEKYVQWLSSFGDFGFNYSHSENIMESDFAMINQSSVFDILQNRDSLQIPFLIPPISPSEWNWEIVDVDSNISTVLFTSSVGLVEYSSVYEDVYYKLFIANLEDFYVILGADIYLQAYNEEDSYSFSIMVDEI